MTSALRAFEVELFELVDIIGGLERIVRIIDRLTVERLKYWIKAIVLSILYNTYISLDTYIHTIYILIYQSAYLFLY